ncbi:MAG: hypothetical protein ABDH23_06400, partial [Endomicrobiia bacterium]
LDSAEYGDDPLLSKGGKGVVSGDVGGVYSLSDNLRLGVVLKDIVNPDIGLGSEEKVGMGYLAGISYVSISGDNKFIYSLGYYGRGSDSSYSVGVEGWLSKGKVGIRGSYSDVRYSLGVSYNLDKIRIDYTYAIPSQLTDTQGSHYIGLVFRF